MEKNTFGTTLLDCPVRFAGHYGRQYIKQFTEFIQSYKTIKRIPDEQALEELIHLLTNHAYNWWRRRRHLFVTWPEALSALTEEFGKRRPAYMVYAEIFQCNQQSFDDDGEMLDFIIDKIELLHELPEQLDDSIEARHFHMIWALLPPQKRARLAYLNINCLDKLMEYINESMKTKTKSMNDSKHNKRPKQNDGENNNDRSGPIIKVKRTADLMPIISSTTKQPEDGNGNGNGHKNTFDITRTNASDNRKLTTPTTEEVNSVVIDDDDDDYEDEDDDAEDDDDVDDDDGDGDDDYDDDANADSSKMPQITYLLNGETTIAPELPLPSIQKPSSNSKSGKQQQQTQEALHRKEARCSFCHNTGHRLLACLKRLKYMQLYSDHYKPKPYKSIKTIKDALQLNRDFILNDNVVVSSISNKIPSNTSISLQQVDTQRNGNDSTGKSNGNNSNITIRKITKPINGANATKNDLKIIHIKSNSDNRNNSNANSNSKCHQCGAVGYYRSICPNCSPIYYYKQSATSSLPPLPPPSSASSSF